MRALLLVRPFEQPVFSSELDGSFDVNFRDQASRPSLLAITGLPLWPQTEQTSHLTSFATTEQVLETSVGKYHYSSHGTFGKGRESDENGIQTFFRL